MNWITVPRAAIGRDVRAGSTQLRRITSYPGRSQHGLRRPIRYSLRPARVSFRSCSSEADFLITISEDLIDVSVAGLTKINGAKDRFNVTLQHYPSSVDVEGFQMTAVELRSAP